MSRIRSIHPGFFTDEDFVQVSAFARLLLLGLGTEADDKGTFPWKPVSLKMKLFPMDMVDIQELLRELTDADAIRRYQVDGKEFGAIRNFRVHQRPKKPNDLHPMPDELRTYVGLTYESSEPVGNRWGKTSADGGEGRGEERRMEDGEERRMEDGEERRMEDGEERRGGATGKGSKLPRTFEPILTDTAKGIVSRWPQGMLERELEKFRDHHTAKGSVMEDWQAAFRTWLRNADEWRYRNGNGNRDNRGSGNGLLDAALDEMGERGRFVR
jgi:hypothetical protein